VAKQLSFRYYPVSTIVPILKDLHSPDVEDLDSYAPENSRCFGFLLQAFFGPEDAEGEESFDVVVCTPEWLARGLHETKIIEGRHHLIVSEWDLDAIRSYLATYGRSCEGFTWREAATRLSRLGKWEFEDYRVFEDEEGK
jgi:hypothetical protein